MSMKAAFTSNHLYPTSDGKPMAETDRHRHIMSDLIDVLKRHFAGDSNAYVSGNLLIFNDPKGKRKHLSPDTFVVFGVPDVSRRNPCGRSRCTSASSCRTAFTATSTTTTGGSTPTAWPCATTPSDAPPRIL